MSLTKKDLETISKMISKAINNNTAGNQIETPDWDRWEKEGIKSKLLGVTLAPENYFEGDKKYFTWDEAMEAQKHMPKGWRLPTKSEWVILCEEFCCEDNGGLSSGKAQEILKLGLDGYVGTDGELYGHGSYGYFWSSTASSATSARYTYFFNSGYVNPGRGSNPKSYGFAVRCIKSGSMEFGNDK